MISRILMLLIFLALSANSAFAESEGIAWIPTWQQAFAEASKTHKPIFLLSAAPQCAGIPGIW
ncbi:MAG: hypothetical protein K2X27_02205 [Candidatus Obscuribacterales bacterium]|nr:hypothetical protein [Candidatus Obscuribacterales bacterium]